MTIRLFLFLLCLSPTFSFGQPKKKLRKTKEIQLNAAIDYQSNQPQLRLTFFVTRLLGNETVDNLSLKLELTSPAMDQVFLDTTIRRFPAIEKINQHFTYHYKLPTSRERLALKITLTDELRQSYQSLDIYVLPPLSQVGFSWENLTQKNRLTPKQTDSLIFKSQVHQQLWVYRFKPNFFPAAPPMQRKIASGSRSMQVDSLFSIPTNQVISFQKEALYFVQEDTLGSVGLGFRIAPSDYPAFKRVDRIANALIYITTLKDISDMLATNDQKATLDEFWLDLGGSEVNARRLIKAYYQRVAYANYHFSSHKLGWKTDKGMIYIVFGPPNEIIKGNDYEVWRYANQPPGNSRVEFQFIHKPGLFSHNHFQLRRGTSLRSFWYNKVKEWRKGTILTFE